MPRIRLNEPINSEFKSGDLTLVLPNNHARVQSSHDISLQNVYRGTLVFPLIYTFAYFFVRVKLPLIFKYVRYILIVH